MTTRDRQGIDFHSVSLDSVFPPSGLPLGSRQEEFETFAGSFYSGVKRVNRSRILDREIGKFCSIDHPTNSRTQERTRFYFLLGDSRFVENPKFGRPRQNDGTFNDYCGDEDDGKTIATTR